MAPAAKNTKPVFKTASPFTETRWPEISQNDQEIILDLACNLIAPLGDHRKAHMYPSKGKKRKRKSKGVDDASSVLEAPPRPEIGKHILIGINSVTRHLEARASLYAPKTMPVATSEKVDVGNEATKDLRPLSMVILTHPNPSVSPAHAHIPTLVRLSGLQPPTSSISNTGTATRLIPLASSTDTRLACALHIPRVGALALFADAPGAKALETFARENVDITECTWLDEATKASWKGLNVETEFASKRTPETSGKKDKRQGQIRKLEG